MGHMVLVEITQLCIVTWEQPQSTHTQMSVDTFQENFIYKTSIGLALAPL